MTIAITVVVFVAAGRLVTSGVAAGGSRPFAETSSRVWVETLLLSPADTGESPGFWTTRLSSAIVISRLQGSLWDVYDPKLTTGGNNRIFLT